MTKITKPDGEKNTGDRATDEPSISARTLEMMDATMSNLEAGQAGEPLDPETLLRGLRGAGPWPFA